MKIVNIVATVTLSHPLDLQKLQLELPGIDFSPKVQWLKMRVQPDGNYVAFYKSGKFLVSSQSSSVG
jgi:transcription initiation factor TFIID TATA-box-binding protein